MGQNVHEIDIRDLKQIFNVSEHQSIDDSFFYAPAEYTPKNSIFQEPCRSAAYLVFYCVSGEFTLQINLSQVHVAKNTLVVVVPGTICQVKYPEKKKEETSIMALAASREYLSSVRLDFNTLSKESFSIMNSPAITINKEHFSICSGYFSLLKQLCESNIPDRKEAIRFIISSLFVFIGELWEQSVKKNEQTVLTSKKNIRAQLIFDNFILLVTEHHINERKVMFYAHKLCLTPKYLSKLVKSVSGQSAPEWIDAFVILEAKNMLKYTDMPVKEIVFQLHFPNQSVFYKFFKSHTGMTPNQYREK